MLGYNNVKNNSPHSAVNCYTRYQEHDMETQVRYKKINSFFIITSLVELMIRILYETAIALKKFLNNVTRTKRQNLPSP